MAGHARVTWDLAQDKVTIAAEFPTPPNSIDEVDEDAPVVRLGNRAQKLLPNRSALIMCADRRVRLSSLTAHVLNLPNFLCGTKNSTDIWHESADARRRLGRIVLIHDGWTMELQAVPGITEVVAELKKTGGNAVTHVLHIRKTDGRKFTIRSAEKVMNDLYEFLSFARGSWTSVFGLVGFSAVDTVAYENWGMRLATRWETNH